MPPSSSLRSYPVVEASDVHLGQSLAVREQGLGYCSQLMEKQQLQRLQVCQFSQKDPRPAIVILKLIWLRRAPEKSEMIFKKAQYEVQKKGDHEQPGGIPYKILKKIIGYF